MSHQFESRHARNDPPWARHHQPKIFSAQGDGWQQLLETPGMDVRDSLFDQVCELIEIRHPGENFESAELAKRAEEHIKNAAGTADHYGNWVHFPWRNTVVHVVGESEFLEIRGSRNRNKIRRDEQLRLRDKTLGIVGLSVGNIIALTLAMEGVAGAFHLADFDEVALSNTNRMLCGLPEVGIHKARYCAQRMYEIDPYLRIELFEDGLTEDNASAFLDPLDLLVEECDGLPMKVRVRELARARKLPVIMETNDRGVLDIERFDLEPERELFHGLLEGVTSAQLAAATRAEQLPVIFKLMGGAESLSKRSAESLAEIGKSLRSWPQLGSDTVLGGAVVTHCARRILLGELRQSGRFYVDLSALISG